MYKWIPIIGYEDYYEISSLGEIRNNKKKILKTYINNSGYECIKLQKEAERKSFLVHRLVALCFYRNTNDEVNHISGDKLNNIVSNLEWVNRSANTQHGLRTGLYDSLYNLKNSLGKKHLKVPTSKYHNVGYDRFRGKWKATIRVNGRNHKQKRFDTEEEAALYVNQLIDELGLLDRPKNIICI